MTRYWKCVVIIHLYKIEQICCPWHILKFYLSYHVVSPNRTLLVYTVFCWCQGILVMHFERLKPGLYSMRAYAPAAGADAHACGCLCVATAYSKLRRGWKYKQATVCVGIRPHTSLSERRVGPRWPWSAFVISWNACAGLRWPWKFNKFELCRRQSAYVRVCAGRNRRQKYKQLRRQSAYTRAWSINPA